VDQEKEGIFIRRGFVIPPSEFVFQYTCSSGPGGQNVNKTHTKVRLKWWPEQSASARRALSPAEWERFARRMESALAEDGSLQWVSDRFRTRESNQRECCLKLAVQVRAWLKKPKKRIPTRPTKASKRKRLENKKARSRIKKDRRDPGLED
jgi:ribosome-associated protein